MRNIGAPELLLILLVLVLLFGAKKLPDVSRSLGRSMRIFKSEVKQMKDDDEDARPSSSSSSSQEPRSIEQAPLEGTVHRDERAGETPRQSVPEADRRDS